MWFGYRLGTGPPWGADESRESARQNHSTLTTLHIFVLHVVTRSDADAAVGACGDVARNKHHAPPFTFVYTAVLTASTSTSGRSRPTQRVPTLVAGWMRFYSGVARLAGVLVVVGVRANFGQKEDTLALLGTLAGSSPQLCDSVIGHADPKKFSGQVYPGKDRWDFNEQRDKSDCESGFSGTICEDCPDVAIQTLWTSADRPSLWKNIVGNLVRSTYPGNVRLVLFDQSPTPNAALKRWVEDPGSRVVLGPNKRVDYYFVQADTKATHVATGAARNLNNRLCAGSDVILVMDSDDFFGRAYVSHRVSAWLHSAGSAYMSEASSHWFITPNANSTYSAWVEDRQHEVERTLLFPSYIALDRPSKGFGFDYTNEGHGFFVGVASYPARCSPTQMVGLSRNWRQQPPSENEMNLPVTSSRNHTYGVGAFTEIIKSDLEKLGIMVSVPVGENQIGEEHWARMMKDNEQKHGKRRLQERGQEQRPTAEEKDAGLKECLTTDKVNQIGACLKKYCRAAEVSAHSLLGAGKTNNPSLHSVRLICSHICSHMSRTSSATCLTLALLHTLLATLQIPVSAEAIIASWPGSTMNLAWNIGKYDTTTSAQSVMSAILDELGALAVADDPDPDRYRLE